MKKSFLLLITFAAVLVSCGDDDSSSPIIPEEEKISLSDPNALTAAISFEGSTAITGTPPAPSTDPSAPKLDESGDAIGIAGQGLVLPINQSTDNEIAGVYFKIKGSESYYDIPASSLGLTNGRIFGKRNGRKQKVQVASAVTLALPNNLEPGVFCVEYCIYDAENRVSNIIEVCIEVLYFAGENSEFLTANEWELVSDYYKEIYNGDTFEETSIVGEDDVYAYTTYLVCNDGSHIEADVEQIDRTDYLYVSFLSDGTYTTDEKYYEKDMDDNNSSCEAGVLYTEETTISNQEGGWSYNSTNNTITLLSQFEWQDGETTYSETSVDVFDLSIENGQLIISAEENETDYYFYTESTLKPKN